MHTFDFKALDSPATFQRLCADLLEAEGGQSAKGHGFGPDQGCDFLVQIKETSLFGEHMRTYLVECKCWSDGRSVGQSEVSDALTSLSVHGADGLLFISTSGFSGTAVTKMNAFNRQRSDPRAAVYWDASDVSKRLWKHPRVVARYFGSSPSASEPETRAQAATSAHVPMDRDYRTPRRYFGLTFQNLPLRSFGDPLSEEIRSALEAMRSSRARVVLLTGGTGSGKTSLACGLSNEMALSPEKTCFYSSLDYVELFEYSYREDPSYLNRVDDLKNAEYLVIDDFGEYLRDETESQRFGFECLRDVIETRRRLGRSTFLAIYYDLKRIGPTARQYLDLLRAVELSIDLGPKNRRPSNRPTKLYSHGTYLGRDWLCGKLEGIENRLGHALHICVMPEEMHLGQQRTIFELYGVPPVAKQDEVAGRLSALISFVKSCREFLEPLPFVSLFFSDDGTVQLICDNGPASADTRRKPKDSRSRSSSRRPL